MKIANSERQGSKTNIAEQQIRLQNNLFIMCKRYTLFTTFFVSFKLLIIIISVNASA